ncbi:MAG: aromatic ring-hydroxylating dioxygenase subunit alpha [Rhodospirillaceae bacterium]|nr:aromatic ring-hydroxylating dioxygenase subunit alpha [Rhodospirillaceae bacterium]
MIINNWYVAEESPNVPAGAPVGVRMLGFDFVLFRDGAGKVHCLTDVCCHRGAALSDGELADGGGCIACPYHGWRFDARGRCVRIPALGDEAKIPKRARIDSYPTAEKYGWIWVFLGDLTEAERPHIPDLFPEYDDETWTKIPYRFEAKCNWMRMEENSLDTAHTNFVHKAFGARANPKLSAAPIEPTEWGARVTRTKPAPAREAKSGEIAKLLSEDRAQTAVTLEFSVIGVCHRIHPTFRPGMSQINFTARTPIDRFRTRAIGWQARNYLPGEQHNPERMAGIQQAVAEDLRVVEKVKPPLTPPTLSDEFLTETDGMELAFRRKVWGMAARGWEIDWEAYQKLVEDHVVVIPSPARREEPKNWVHTAVPLRPPAPPKRAARSA